MMECSEAQPFMDESLACGCKKKKQCQALLLLLILLLLHTSGSTTIDTSVSSSTTSFTLLLNYRPCRVGSVGSVSASRTEGREFASRPGHTKGHHKNGTNCLPA